MDPALLSTINESYAAFLPEESWSGYKYPDQEITGDGAMNWVDLPISHAKYGGKYDDHVPIDLPHWYCTMSQGTFPYAAEVWDFISHQPMANVVGPLGQRAGLDIKELYPNVMRMYPFADARSWVNVGVGAETDYFTQTSFDAGDPQTVMWEASAEEVEYYMIERPFFNVPYLFVTAVYANDDLSYVRPSGLYYEHLLSRGFDSMKTTFSENPRFELETYSRDNETSLPAIGTPLYGVNHHNRRHDYMTGGACPLRGGDWGYYPFSNSGAGWPTNYEEISPLCDAVIMDIKLWANLGVETWNDPNLFLGNAGVATPSVEYFMDANLFGFYTDDYLANETNPYAIDMTSDGQLVEPGSEDVETVSIRLEYPAVEPTMPVMPVQGCDDSTMWYKFGDPSKNCAWVSQWEPRCDAVGIDGDSTGTVGLVRTQSIEPSYAMDACPKACGMC